MEARLQLPVMTASSLNIEKKPRPRGLTLLELMLAVAIMGGFLVGLVMALQNMFRMSHSNTQLSGALQVANVCLEGVKALESADLFKRNPDYPALVVARLTGPANAEVKILCNDEAEEVYKPGDDKQRYMVTVRCASEPDLTFWARKQTGTTLPEEQDLEVNVPDIWVKRFDIEVRFEQWPRKSGRWRSVGARTWRANLQ